MNIRSPLAQAKALGSARNGTSHFMMQRLSGVILALVTLYLPFAVASLVHADGYDGILDWFNNPLHAGLCIAFMLTGFYHAALGLQVVIEDYVHCPLAKIIALIAVKTVLFMMALIALISIVQLALA